VSSQYRSKITEKIRALIREDKLVALVNNAAVQIIKPMEHINVGDWDNSLNVNVVAPFVLTQILLSDLEEGEGSVVNVASIHATLTKPGFICYATSKAALVGLTKSMAIELGPRVRVNAICPAAVATPMLLAGFEGKKKELDTLSNMHPLGRIADPYEVAKSALFLVSDSASFISGATLEVCGGISARLHDPL
jgi:NAD(P)-dependent dehydrogenase (short-subunit alcohol dehydrogenase family)